MCMGNLKNNKLTFAQNKIKEHISQKQKCWQTESFQFHNSDNHSDYSDYSDYYVYGDSDYSISFM